MVVEGLASFGDQIGHQKNTFAVDSGREIVVLGLQDVGLLVVCCDAVDHFETAEVVSDAESRAVSVHVDSSCHSTAGNCVLKKEN